MGGGGGAPASDIDAVLAQSSSGASGFRGLFANRKTLAIATFASLGGVLYGYNQVRRRPSDTIAYTNRVYSDRSRS